jgi:hypothetical protein
MVLKLTTQEILTLITISSVLLSRTSTITNNLTSSTTTRGTISSTNSSGDSHHHNLRATVVSLNNKDSVTSELLDSHSSSIRLLHHSRSHITRLLSYNKEGTTLSRLNQVWDRADLLSNSSRSTSPTHSQLELVELASVMMTSSELETTTPQTQGSEAQLNHQELSTPEILKWMISSISSTT